jgi:beta-galactosidase
VETSCELMSRTDPEVVLRPTQATDVVVLETDRAVTTTRGTVTSVGTRVTVTLDDAGPGPVTVRLT